MSTKAYSGLQVVCDSLLKDCRADSESSGGGTEHTPITPGQSTSVYSFRNQYRISASREGEGGAKIQREREREEEKRTRIRIRKHLQTSARQVSKRRPLPRKVRISIGEPGLEHSISFLVRRIINHDKYSTLDEQIKDFERRRYP
jgi:hypothetical protein